MFEDPNLDLARTWSRNKVNQIGFFREDCFDQYFTDKI